MKRFTVIPDYDSDLEALLKVIHDEFLDRYNVDLDADKYRPTENESCKLQDIWSRVVKDCFGESESEGENTPWKALEKFECMFNDIYNINQYETMYHAEEPSDKQKSYPTTSQLVEKLVESFLALEDKYMLYETSVWTDAAFAIEYIENVGFKSRKFRSYTKRDISVARKQIKKKLGHTDFIPFSKKDLRMGFCDNIKIYLMSQNGAGFLDTDACFRKGTNQYVEGEKGKGKKDFQELDITETEDGYLRTENRSSVGFSDSVGLTFLKVNTSYLPNSEFTRWSYEKVIKKFTDKKLKLEFEDRLFLYELTDTIVVLNAANEFTENSIKLSDGRGLLWHIENVKSISWRLFLVCFYADLVDLMKKIWLDVSDLYCISRISPQTMSSIDSEKITKNAYTLSRGLVYLYFKFEEEYYYGAEEYEPLVNDSLNVLMRYEKPIREKMIADRKEITSEKTEKELARLNDTLNYAEEKKKKHLHDNSDDKESAKKKANDDKEIAKTKANIEECKTYGYDFELRTDTMMDYENNSGIQWYYAFLQRDVIAPNKRWNWKKIVGKNTKGKSQKD